MLNLFTEASRLPSFAIRPSGQASTDSSLFSAPLLREGQTGPRHACSEAGDRRPPRGSTRAISEMDVLAGEGVRRTRHARSPHHSRAKGLFPRLALSKTYA